MEERTPYETQNGPERPREVQKSGSLSEELTGKLSQLSPEQKRYVIARLRTKTRADAAEQAGVKADTVYHWPPLVDECVNLLLLDTVAAAHTLLAQSLAHAASVKLQGLESQNEKVRQGASTEIMDRNLGRAVQAMDLRHSVSDELRQFMQELVGLGEEPD
jgi:hypothetical protein